jgi:hypothetical protein
MKKLFFSLLIASPLFSFAQSVTADPALEPMKITTLVSGIISISQLPLNGIIKLKVPILNKNIANALPAGSCKVKIGLGSKLILDPTFNLTTVNTSNFFTWSAVSSGGQVQIIGDLINELPANFNDTAYFDVRGSIVGNSTITTNFLVTNHNTTVTLSDENGANNNAATAYAIIVNALPVTFTDIFTEKKDCSLKVFFDIENEINVNRYELEVSKDFNTFEKIATVSANNLKRYTFDYFTIPETYQVPILLVRIKSVDMDGKFQYSEIKKTAGTCNSKVGLSLYPNPVPKNTYSFYLQKDNGFFNGTYSISILDMAGKLIKTTEIKLINIARFTCNMDNVSAGQYLIKVYNTNSKTIEILKVVKL